MSSNVYRRRVLVSHESLETLGELKGCLSRAFEVMIAPDLVTAEAMLRLYPPVFIITEYQQNFRRAQAILQTAKIICPKSRRIMIADSNNMNNVFEAARKGLTHQTVMLPLQIPELLQALGIVASARPQDAITTC